MVRICPKKPVQRTGTTARQPYDEKRFSDFLTWDVWINLPVPFQLQTRAQRLQSVDLQCNSSDQIEPGFVLA
jgi:hypothetical protein